MLYLLGFYYITGLGLIFTQYSMVNKNNTKYKGGTIEMVKMKKYHKDRYCKKCLK